ncbi:MAG: TetR/AcrR family transcriptional regulator [Pseudohongiellaceae bacterium]
MSTGTNVDGDNGPGRKKRTGGRSARVREQALEAALAELGEVGYSGFNMARIAARAGVHETTIYRRWPTKEDLVIDACMAFADQQLPVPDTGDLATDLRIVLDNIVTAMSSPVGHNIVFLGMSARTIPEFAEVGPAFWRSRLEIGQQVFDYAAARGDWPADYDKETIFAELLGPLIATYFLLGKEIDDEYLNARVGQIMALYQPGK